LEWASNNNADANLSHAHPAFAQCHANRVVFSSKAYRHCDELFQASLQCYFENVSVKMVEWYVFPDGAVMVTVDTDAMSRALFTPQPNTP
jgi:hypothetical protein